MMALTVAIHTYGSSLWLKFMGRRLDKLAGAELEPPLFQFIATTATALLFLHLLEAMLWALLYMQLPGQAGLTDLGQALYFSMVTITTLGYGDVTLAPAWQVLAGMEGMVGIVVFGLTTAMLFAVVRKSWLYAHSRVEKMKSRESKG